MSRKYKLNIVINQSNFKREREIERAEIEAKGKERISSKFIQVLAIHLDLET